MLNGDGLRVVLWVSGCEHRCKGCQNPITWDINDGVTFDESTEFELLGKLNKNYISGITFSGGDPLHPDNRVKVTELCEKIKKLYPEKTIWLYTGYLWEEIKNLDLLKFIDVLVDGPYIEQLHDNRLHWKGSSNQRVIDVQRSLFYENLILKE